MKNLHSHKFTEDQNNKLDLALFVTRTVTIIRTSECSNAKNLNLYLLIQREQRDNTR